MSPRPDSRPAPRPQQRQQRRQQQRQQPQQAPPQTDNYAMIVGGLVSCRRCAALLQDTRPAREQHDNHHQALRAMYERIGGQR